MKGMRQAFMILIALLLNISTGNSQGALFDWLHQIGGNSNERGTAIEQDTNGNIYCAGEVSDTVYFADTIFVANFGDIFLSKFSSNGNLQWVRTCGGSGLDRGLDLKIDGNDDVIVTGFFSSTATFGDTTLTSTDRHDLFIAKYDSQGDFLWVVQGAGIDDDEGLCLAIDQNDNIYVGGFFETSMLIGPFNLSGPVNFASMFVAKISSSGTVLWANQAVMQDFGESAANDLICDNSGNVIVTGYFDDTATFQDTTIYSYDGSEDVFVVKYASNGNRIWLKQAGGNGDDNGLAITVDPSSNSYLTGGFRLTATFGSFIFTSADNNEDLFLAKLDPSGNFLWARHGSGAQRDSPHSIFYNQINGIAVCGGYANEFNIGDSTFNSGATENIFAAIFTPTGNFRTAFSIGDNGDDAAWDIYLNDSNDAYLIGDFEQSIWFGDSLLVSHNLADVFITKANLDQINDISISKSLTVIKEYRLYQNYPNPFNPKTTIRFKLPISQKVELKIYDLLGGEVKTLIDQILRAGVHEVEFDGRGLASGIYLCQIKGEKFAGTRKMILLK